MPPQVPKIPAVDRLSRDTTDLLVIAREMQRAGAGIDHSPSRSSIRLPILPSLQSWVLLQSSNIAASGATRTGKRCGR
jgi:hypothetical protein